MDASGVVAQFSEHGCLVLGSVFPASFVAELYEAYEARYGGITAEEMESRCRQPGATPFFEVGQRRYEVAPVLKPPFSDPRLYANDMIRSLIDPLLGEGYKVSSLTIVVSYPGSEMQHVHRDHSHLFPQENVGRDMPPHAINVAVPLVDLDAEVGSTGLWLGSHRWETDAPCNVEQMVAPTLQRGDCMMIDYRTMHGGLPNRSTRVRPILYVVYARPWFFDEKNFVSRNPLDMPEEEYAKLEPAMQELMSRSARMRLLMKR
jgi:ectoine hydroxylase-related dioxygenase (phytanoyl-CoA dioxygenase family)